MDPGWIGAAGQMDRGDGFKGRQFTAEVILWAVRWYLMFPIRALVQIAGAGKRPVL
jgi:hypothetical protein